MWIESGPNSERIKILLGLTSSEEESYSPQPHSQSESQSSTTPRLRKRFESGSIKASEQAGPLNDSAGTSAAGSQSAGPSADTVTGTSTVASSSAESAPAVQEEEIHDVFCELAELTTDDASGVSWWKETARYSP